VLQNKGTSNNVVYRVASVRLPSNLDWAFQEKNRAPPVEEVQPFVTYPLGIPGNFRIIPLWNSEFLQIFNHYPFGIPLIFDGFSSTPMEFHCISNLTPLERKWTSSTGGARFFSGKAHYENKEGRKRNKALYAIWSGAEPSRKENMLIASTTKEVGRKCNGFAKKASFHEWFDLTEQNFIDALCN